MKIFTIVGARPNFIKVDPQLPQTIIHTGQHYDFKMSEIFFRGLNLPKPKYNLNCTDTGQMIDKLRIIFRRNRPDLIVVIGDTNSALAGALAGSMENIRVAHVEAGLRSFNQTMPEEKNRVVIDRVSYLLFCPNQEAQLNLMKEGIKDNVFVVGDPLFESMGRFAPFKKTKDYQKYILLTTHRNFNVDNAQSLQSILDAIGESGEKTIFPVHPRTRKMIRSLKINVPSNISLKPPAGYKQMLSLISNAKKVITDSGGVQREAFWMNVPVIILRDETEWREIINKQGGILVGTKKESILHAIQNFKNRLSGPPTHNANAKIKEIIYRYI